MIEVKQSLLSSIIPESRIRETAGIIPVFGPIFVDGTVKHPHGGVISIEPLRSSGGPDHLGSPGVLFPILWEASQGQLVQPVSTMLTSVTPEISLGATGSV